jgi:hypothetical protein
MIDVRGQGKENLRRKRGIGELWSAGCGERWQTSQEHDKIDKQQATLADNNPRPAISDLRENMETPASGCCDVGHLDSAGGHPAEEV